MAWASLTYSGTFWLSDNEVYGAPLSRLYVYSTLAGGATLVALALLARRGHAGRVVEDRFVIGGGIVAGVGCLLLLLIGPYYFGSSLTGVLRELVFAVAAILTGVGTGCLGMRCGVLFSLLPPRRTLIYAGCATLMTAFLYFAILASPAWAPIEHGPSCIDIFAFVLLPLIAAAWSCMRSPVGRSADLDAGAQAATGFKGLPRGFWRLAGFAFGISAVATFMRSSIVSTGELTDTVGMNNTTMLLRIAMALAVILYALASRSRGTGLGRVCTVVAVTSAVVAAAASALGGITGGMGVLVGFLMKVFELLLLCILAFISAQGRMSAVVVFGLGYGLYMLGCGLGWAIGFYALPALGQGLPMQVIYLVCAGLTLLLAVVLFSERDYESMFSSDDGSSASLEDMFEAEERAFDASDQPVGREEKRGRFYDVTERLGNSVGLSAREMDVFRYIAMGYGSERIADEIMISVNTVRVHTRNVYVKFDVHSRDDIMRLVDAQMQRL